MYNKYSFQEKKKCYSVKKMASQNTSIHFAKILDKWFFKKKGRVPEET